MMFNDPQFCFSYYFGENKKKKRWDCSFSRLGGLELRMEVNFQRLSWKNLKLFPYSFSEMLYFE
jgi:hypothetical protein